MKNIECARNIGEQAATACFEKALRGDPDFADKAAAAILRHLRMVHRASGEDLTDIAIAQGARPHEPRAFGAIFRALSRSGLIRTYGFCLRRKGHATAGGRIWELVG